MPSLGAVLPLLSEAAVAAGVPGMAARASASVIGATKAGSASVPTAFIGREAAKQFTTQLEQQQLQQQQPQQTPMNPALEQLLAGQDLSLFPSISRAMQESGGQRFLQHAFGTLDGPLNPEFNELPGQQVLRPQDLLTPTATPTGMDVQDGATITGDTQEY